MTRPYVRTSSEPKTNNKIVRTDDIRKAVLKALSKEKFPYRLSDRGHEPRISLSRRLAAILKGIEIPRVKFSGFGPKYYYPERVLINTSKILKNKFGRDVIVKKNCYQGSHYDCILN